MTNKSHQKPEISISTSSEDETQEKAKVLGEYIRKGDLILLSGDLGAGKTRFVQGLTMGINSSQIARSPTFVFINEYKGKIDITHCDFYRIEDNENLHETGIEEYYDNSLVLMEWPERIKNNLPKDNLIIKILFNENENERTIKFFTSGNKSKQLFERIIINYETNNSWHIYFKIFTDFG